MRNADKKKGGKAEGSHFIISKEKKTLLELLVVVAVQHGIHRELGMAVHIALHDFHIFSIKEMAPHHLVHHPHHFARVDVFFALGARVYA